MLSPLSAIRTTTAMLRARLPQGLPVVPPKPRRENVWRQDGAVLVSRVHAEGDALRQGFDRLSPAAQDNVKAAVARSLELLGGLGREEVR